MANLIEVAELSWRQLFPDPSNMPVIKKEEFIATARGEYALQTLLKYFKDKTDEGYSEVPSMLLDEQEFDVVDKQIDLSKEKIMRGLPNDMWLQNVGGVAAHPVYMKTTVNLWQILSEDGCLGEGVRPYFLVGQYIKFPLGAHKNKLSVLFAGAGKRVDDKINIDDAVAAIIRTRLIEIYGGKTGQVDETNNGNSKS